MVAAQAEVHLSEERASREAQMTFELTTKLEEQSGDLTRLAHEKESLRHGLQIQSAAMGGEVAAAMAAHAAVVEGMGLPAPSAVGVLPMSAVLPAAPSAALGVLPVTNAAPPRAAAASAAAASAADDEATIYRRRPPHPRRPPTATAAEVHTALESRGHAHLSLSDVKKACSKATKQAKRGGGASGGGASPAWETPPPPASAPPPPPRRRAPPPPPRRRSAGRRGGRGGGVAAAEASAEAWADSELGIDSDIACASPGATPACGSSPVADILPTAAPTAEATARAAALGAAAGFGAVGMSAARLQQQLARKETELATARRSEAKWEGEARVAADAHSAYADRLRREKQDVLEALSTLRGTAAAERQQAKGRLAALETKAAELQLALKDEGAKRQMAESKRHGADVAAAAAKRAQAEANAMLAEANAKLARLRQTCEQQAKLLRRANDREKALEGGGGGGGAGGKGRRRKRPSSRAGSRASDGEGDSGEGSPTEGGRGGGAPEGQGGGGGARRGRSAGGGGRRRVCVARARGVRQRIGGRVGRDRGARARGGGGGGGARGAARASDAERREERRVAKARRDDGGRLREAHAENERLQEGVRSLQQKAEALIATNDELMRTNGSLHAQLRAAGRLGAAAARAAPGASPPRLASPPRGGRSGALEPLHTEMLGVGERPPWKPWMRKGRADAERALELGPEGTVAMLRSMIDE